MSLDLRILDNTLANDLINALIIFAGAWLVSRVVRFLFAALERRITARTATVLDDRALRAVQGPVGVFVWLLGLRWALGGLNVTAWGLFSGEQAQVAAGWERVVDHIFFLLLAIVVVVFINRTFGLATRWYAERFAARTESTVDDELLPLVERVFQVLVWAVALIVVFDHFGIGISSLVVTLGAGSLAFALAAQETLANMIGGFVIFVDRPFRIGDRVLLENGTKGDVLEIGLRSTRILTFENTVMVVPNAQIINEKVNNLSYPDPRIRVMVDFGVAYGTDLDRVKEIVVALAEAHEQLLDDPAPRVYFVEFGDSALMLRLVARTPDAKEQWSITEEVRMGIWRALEENGISIPFPQREVWFRNLPEQAAREGS